jgi:hypothetical protein
LLNEQKIKVIIPACNEAASIGHVLKAIPTWADEILVVDNGSTDATADLAAQNGARVVDEPRRGYGQACLAGIAALGSCDIVVFLDADFSDFPEEMDKLVTPIARDQADMVIGSRRQTPESAAALTTVQQFGNCLACFLMGIVWRTNYTDLGPFRAIRSSSLRRLNMQDRNFGWTIEMQIKAIRAQLRISEVAVKYRDRIGVSKISGTLRGVIGAGSKILWTIFRQTCSPSSIYPHVKNRLIVFSRYPLPGHAKTRLIPALGATGAASLQRKMTEHCLQNVAHLQTPNRRIEIHYTGGTQRQMHRWLGHNFTYRQQSPGNLGQRMERAFRDSHTAGCDRTVIMGTDCLELSGPILEKAFEKLDAHDLVLGPSADGGYYLIGMKKPVNVFSGIEWGQGSVLTDTLRLAEQKGQNCAMLEVLSDVDHPKDLQNMPEHFREDEPYLSVIIPTLNEAGFIKRSIHSAQGDGAEIIVVDGGSIDGTCELAEKAGAAVSHSTPGRALQMNQGAMTARGQVFLFLHADTVIEADYTSSDERTKPYVTEIFNRLSNANVMGGAFRFKTDYPGLVMSFFQCMVDLRNRLLHMPYGDQGIFIRKEVFDAIGGFPAVSIGEDVQLVKALKAYPPLVHLNLSAITSGRRWRQKGLLPNTLINLLVLGGLTLQIPNPVLARIYK